jgi:mRNA interferase RelE/StbE
VAYTIQITEAAEKMLKKLDRPVQTRIRQVIDSLAENPRPSGVKKLKDAGALYRVRVGDYRIVYEIRDRQLVVIIIRIGHRKEVYR